MSCLQGIQERPHSQVRARHCCRPWEPGPVQLLHNIGHMQNPDVHPLSLSARHSRTATQPSACQTLLPTMGTRPCPAASQHRARAEPRRAPTQPACLCRCIVCKEFKDGYKSKRMPDTEASRHTWPCPTASQHWAYAKPSRAPTQSACLCRYIVYKEFENDYAAKRMPDTEANRDTWPCPATPENTDKGCPFSVMTDVILDTMEKDDKCSLYVTGHRCGTPSFRSSVVENGLCSRTREHHRRLSLQHDDRCHP